MSNSVLQEGGTAGHLNHLYDNRYLTFSKLKEILAAASSGELEGTEKTDGFNIYLGYKDGQARYTRNQSDVKVGGRTAEDLAARVFAGGDNIKNTYINAFKTFEKAVSILSPQEKIDIFGENGNIFYNTEIQGPAASNAINYDINYVTIHRAGHGWFDFETGKKQDIDVTNNAQKLDKAIERMQKAVSDEKFAIQINAIKKLKALENDEALNIAVKRIDKAITAYGISDNHTIEDFLKIKLQFFVEEEFPSLEKEYIQLVIDRIMNNTSLMNKGLETKLRSSIMNFTKDKGTFLLKQAILPLEMAIHDFAVEMLRGMESMFILDNKKEVVRIKNELTKAINAIESSKREDAMEILKHQLSKIKHVDNVSTAAEGFVFVYDGTMYKFTGNFAPVNQLLGLFKFGRGNIPPMAMPSEPESREILPEIDSMEQDSSFEEPMPQNPNVIALVPGGFKPPHGGHYALAMYFANNSKIDNVMVLVSPKSRSGHSTDDRVTIGVEESIKLWRLYKQADSNSNAKKLHISIAPNPSPVRSVYEFLEKMPKGSTAILGLSEKDKDDERFAKAVDYGKKYGVKVEIITTPVFAEGISGTQMRDLIAKINGDKKLFFDNLPSHMHNNEKALAQAWSIVAPSQKKINEKLTFTNLCGLINEALINEDLIKEMSSMASGAVEGSGKSPFLLKKSIKETDKTSSNDSKIINLSKYGSLNIPREELPQIKHSKLDEFTEYLKELGINFENNSTTVEKLTPIQDKVNLERVQGIQNKYSVEFIQNIPVMTSDNKFLIDGHHRWYSLMDINPKITIKTFNIDMKVKDLLKTMLKWGGVETTMLEEEDELLEIYNKLDENLVNEVLKFILGEK